MSYTVQPIGTNTFDRPLVLPVAPAPDRSGKTCFRTENQINFYAEKGPASVYIRLVGTATAPLQTSLQASKSTMGTAEVDFQLPLTTDETGALVNNPASFKTLESVICYIRLEGPDPFAAFDGSLTSCDTLSTDPGRKLHLEATFHALPCPPGQ